MLELIGPSLPVRRPQIGARSLSSRHRVQCVRLRLVPAAGLVVLVAMVKYAGNRSRRDHSRMQNVTDVLSPGQRLIEWCGGTGWGHPFNVLVFLVTAHLGGVRVITAS